MKYFATSLIVIAALFAGETQAVSLAKKSEAAPTAADTPTSGYYGADEDDVICINGVPAQSVFHPDADPENSDRGEREQPLGHDGTHILTCNQSLDLQREFVHVFIVCAQQ